MSSGSIAASRCRSRSRSKPSRDADRRAALRVPIAPAETSTASKPETPPPAASPAAPAGAPAAGSDAKARPLEGAVESVLGKKVQGENGEDLGRVVDVLADEGGRVRAAVIEFGGFLGVGNRRIAVDWSLLRFHPEDAAHALVLSVSVKTLQSVPEYKNSPRTAGLEAEHRARQ